MNLVYLQEIIDPLDHYPGVTPQQHLEACGFVREWVLLWDGTEPFQTHIKHVYAHGGGWSKMAGFDMTPGGKLSYSGDPDLYPTVEWHIHDHIIRMYPHAWVSIADLEGNYQVARLD